LKKNGRNVLVFLGFFSIGLMLGNVSKRKMLLGNSASICKLSLEQCLNRLTEFDLTDQKEATNMFLDLIEHGFGPSSAFDIVQKECFKAEEVLND
jgi:hypothetical protein